MELVASQTTEVEVEAAATETVIDWVNIELLSTFTLQLNTHVVTASSSVTVTYHIDTSDDGGITVTEDAETDSFAITHGYGLPLSFTTSAKFVRVRVSANDAMNFTAYLFAASSSPKLATLADIKTRLGLTDTEHDTTLTRILASLASIFDSFCRRPLIAPAAAVTEYYTGNGPALQLDRYPVISITSIKVSTTWDYDNADALTANSGYRLLRGGEKGIVRYAYNNWPMTDDCIQVVYRGGYCAAGVTPADGEFALPNDLREAAIEQCCFIWKRRDDIGLQSVGFDGGDISKFGPMKLLPIVEQTLKDYRKAPSLG